MSRTPQAVVREWMEAQGLRVGTHVAADDVAALESAIEREREVAFDAGDRAGRDWHSAARGITLESLLLARRAAVEGDTAETEAG